MSSAIVEAPRANGAIKQQQQPEQKSALAGTSVGAAGVQLRSFAEIFAFAKCIANSGLAPKGIDRPESIVIALQMGMELGLPPMASLQNIAVINGRPSLWGDAQLAVVRASGELEAIEEWFEADGKRLPRNPVVYTDDTIAVCRVKRKGCEAMEIGFSVADAKRAGLWAKQGPWSQYPFRMLRFRARSFILRDVFGDALRGLLSSEEAMDIDAAPPAAKPPGRAASLNAMLAEPTREQEPVEAEIIPDAEPAVATPDESEQQPATEQPAGDESQVQPESQEQPAVDLSSVDKLAEAIGLYDAENGVDPDATNSMWKRAKLANPTTRLRDREALYEAWTTGRIKADGKIESLATT